MAGCAGTVATTLAVRPRPAPSDSRSGDAAVAVTEEGVGAGGRVDGKAFQPGPRPRSLPALRAEAAEGSVFSRASLVRKLRG